VSAAHAAFAVGHVVSVLTLRYFDEVPLFGSSCSSRRNRAQPARRSPASGRRSRLRPSVGDGVPPPAMHRSRPGRRRSAGREPATGNRHADDQCPHSSQHITRRPATGIGNRRAVRRLTSRPPIAKSFGSVSVCGWHPRRVQGKLPHLMRTKHASAGVTSTEGSAIRGCSSARRLALDHDHRLVILLTSEAGNTRAC